MDNRLAVLNLAYMQKETIDNTDDNTVIQKMTAPNDEVDTNDTVTVTLTVVANEVWGGTGYIPNWAWGAGQWH
jgi:hypothetical protein